MKSEPSGKKKYFIFPDLTYVGQPALKYPDRELRISSGGFVVAWSVYRSKWMSVVRVEIHNTSLHTGKTMNNDQSLVHWVQTERVSS